MKSSTRRGRADGKMGLRRSKEGSQDKEEFHFQVGFGPRCKPGEAHNIDDLRIFPYLLCLVIFSSYIPVVSVMFSLSLHSPHRHLVSSSLVHLRIIRWSCQFPGPTTSEAAVRRQPFTRSDLGLNS